METSQEDMKFLGVFGIYREGHKIMAPWPKIFNQITLAFIIPVCFIFLAQMGIPKIHFFETPYYHNTNTFTYGAVQIRLNLAGFAYPLIFSLLSTSAVVYTIACMYVNRDISFKKMMGVMLQVCIQKRLIVTFIVIYVFIFIYIVVACVTMSFCLSIGGTASTVLFFILLIVYIIGFVYITTVWQLASVVTILEESFGVKAMKKSRNLIKGKFWVALAISFKLNVLVGTIQLVFYNFVVYGLVWGMWKRVLVGISCLAVLVPTILYGLVLQTIIYFVCKSYHNEFIDKSVLSEHLGEYERLYDPNAVQLKQVYSIALSKAIKSINIVLDQLLTMY